MDFNSLNTRVLKEPLGFIRILEFPLAILAFATTAGHSVSTVITGYPCGPTETPQTSANWGYPFDLTDIAVPRNLCNRTGDFRLFGESVMSQAQFYVFVGVISMLYTLAIVAVYLLAWRNYENDRRLALADFVVTAVLALFWFISSCAWASGVSTYKGESDPGAMSDRLSSSSGGVFPCNNTRGTCVVTRNYNYAALNVSLIVGFACFGLWAANLWFIYKETAWYKARMDSNAPPPTTGPGASGAAPAGAARGAMGGSPFH